MSDLRAPVACEQCGGQKTEVLKLSVEHQPDAQGKLIPQRMVYHLHCPDCGHTFNCELPADSPP